MVTITISKGIQIKKNYHILKAKKKHTYLPTYYFIFYFNLLNSFVGKRS